MNFMILKWQPWVIIMMNLIPWLYFCIINIIINIVWHNLLVSHVNYCINILFSYWLIMHLLLHRYHSSTTTYSTRRDHNFPSIRSRKPSWAAHQYRSQTLEVKVIMAVVEDTKEAAVIREEEDTTDHLIKVGLLGIQGWESSLDRRF